MEAAAAACAWCGAGGDNGSATTFVVPSAPVAAQPALAEAAAGPGEAVPPIPVGSFSLAQKDLRGIGGWLILVALGLGLGPIALLLALGASVLLLFSPEGQSLVAAHPGVTGLLLFNAATDAVLIVLLIVLNVIFYRTKKTFPRWAIGYLVVSFILEIAMHQMMLQYMPTYPSFDAFGSLAAAAIWIPYFLLSQRVKQTFVN